VTKTRLPYGKIRRYLRRPGSKRLPLPGTPGSRQFIAAYEAGLAVSTAAQARSRDYRARLSSAFLFARLKPSPQRLYRIVLDKFREEDGHRLVCDMPRRVARRSSRRSARRGRAWRGSRQPAAIAQGNPGERACTHWFTGWPSNDRQELIRFGFPSCPKLPAYPRTAYRTACAKPL
jgi:hypothetical protein